MKLLLKQILKDFMAKKSLLAVISISIIFMDFLYFFVHFSIDKNLPVIIEALNSSQVISKEEMKYYIALQNNLILVRNFTLAMGAVISIVLFLLLKNNINKKQASLGEIRALGFLERDIIGIHVLLVAGISVFCSLIGLGLGYFGSDILILANTQTYLVEGVMKGINIFTLLIGILFSTMVFCLTSYFACSGIGKKDIAVMIKNEDTTVIRPGFVEAFIHKLPIRNKFRFKLTLKNVSAVALLLIAIVTFNIMAVLGVSLIYSSNKIMDSQLMNRNYRYDITYDTYRIRKDQSESDNIYYLKQEADIKLGSDVLSYHIVGLDRVGPLFQLVDERGDPIQVKGGIILNPELEENYGVKVGDVLNFNMEGVSYVLPVIAIAVNADLKTIYLPKEQMCLMLKQDSHTYNGILTNQKAQGEILLFEDKIAEVERSLTSNRASSLINQSIGIVIGCLLIYLALLIGLNNNIRSILIFDLLGYDNKSINKILINSFLIFINIIFFLTLPIGIMVARNIQIMTSIQTNDYMPFNINPIIFLYMFVIINFICFIVKILFAKKIKRIILAEEQEEFLHEW